MATFSFEDAMGTQPQTFSFEDAQTIQPRDAQGRLKLGNQAFGDFLREEMRNADPFMRNLAAAGTAATDLWEGAKQFVGRGDKQAIEANKIMAEEAPVGAVLGNLGMMAIPLMAAGNSVATAAKVGTVAGALKPVEGDQTAENITRGKIINTAIGGAAAAGGQTVANQVGKYAAGKLADLQLRKAVEAPKTHTLADALDAGFVVPPTTINPTLRNQIMESFAGKAATAQAASNKNSQAFDAMARKALGLADDVPLEPAVLQARRDLAYQVGYKPVADVPAINWDGKFVSDIQALSPSSKGGAVKSPAQAEINDLIGSLTNRGQWTGEQLIYDIRTLRDQARANYRSANMPGGNAEARELARAQDESAKALENLAERNIVIQGGDPNAIRMLREARKYIAKTHTVEDALTEGSGSVNPAALARMIQNGAPLEDELAVAAKFANVYKDAAKPPGRIGSPGVSKLDAALATGAATVGGALGGPVGAVAGAASPFIIPRVARSALLSGRSQNALRDIYRLGLPTRTANALLKYAPVGSTVLGLETLGQ